MPESTTHQLVVFSLGSEEYALPIGAVHEIIRFSEPRSVASEVPWIRGVIGLRGKIVIVSSGAGQVGVMVDEVEEVLTTSSDQLEAVPTASTDSIDSIAKIGDRLVILLNPEGLFARTPSADELAAA